MTIQIEEIAHLSVGNARSAVTVTVLTGVVCTENDNVHNMTVISVYIITFSEALKQI